MTRPPAALLAMAALLAVAAWSLGVWVTQTRWRRALDDNDDLHEQELARVEAERDQAQRDLAEAERAVAELREAIPKVWDAGAATARQMRRHQRDGLEVWAIPPDFAERLRSNRRSN